MLQSQKKIWITGASSGIGKAVTKKFANEGWKVAISARRKLLLEEIASQDNIETYPLDVTIAKDVQNTFDKILKNFGNVDICIFCSGVYNRKTEKEINLEQIKKTFEINFLGTVNCVKSVEKYFKEKKSGQISIVSSFLILCTPRSCLQLI